MKNLKDARGLIDSVFLSWCHGKLKKVKEKQHRNADGTRTRVHTYQLYFPTVHGNETMHSEDIAEYAAFYQHTNW
jgi:hypothetical protein